MLVSVTPADTATPFLSPKNPSLQHTPLHKLDRNIYTLRPQVLTNILAKRIIPTTSIITTIQMTMQQEVHSPHIVHFEMINRLPFVLFRAQ